MAVLWGIRATLQRDRAQKMMAMVVAMFFVAVWIFRLPESMYWYPVVVNGLMLLIFGSSLWAKQTLVERLARLQTLIYHRKVLFTREKLRKFGACFLL